MASPAPLTVLMVAEKPSIAQTLAATFSGGAARKRKGLSPSSPVHEYTGHFLGQPAAFKVTATVGHLYSLDFAPQYNDWNRHPPAELFHAPVVHMEDPRPRMSAHLAQEAKGADVLVLWLDCDREGENICFEVLSVALPHLSDRLQTNVYRAKFSSLAPTDLLQAMELLGAPNYAEARSVDARQEIDLRVGVAFTRFQTQYFRTHFGQQLGKVMVSYGPCQTPTLWFCVKRHNEVQAFNPTPYWELQALVQAPDGGESVRVTSTTGTFWKHDDAVATLKPLQPTAEGRVTARTQRTSRAPPPLPLNTVAMLQAASTCLGLGPADALHCAEQLYLKGFLSYPRTETSRYPEAFDLRGTVECLAAAPEWRTAARTLLQTGLSSPRTDGEDVGDHPPITPIAFAASSAACGGEAPFALYQLVCRHFLATVSPPATFRETKVAVQIGSMAFTVTSTECLDAGWMTVADREPFESQTIPSTLIEGCAVQVDKVFLKEGRTAPPSHLTEAELLSLMERHGIGTDASMATHVSNVVKRQYVTLDAATRELRPSPLGLALVHALTLIDASLVLPSVRANIETQCTLIAKGKQTFEVVVARALEVFERKFQRFCQRVQYVPLLLAVALRPGGPRDGVGHALWGQAEQAVLAVAVEDLLARKVADQQAAESGQWPAAEEPFGEGTEAPAVDPEAAVCEVREALQATNPEASRPAKHGRQGGQRSGAAPGGPESPASPAGPPPQSPANPFPSPGPPSQPHALPPPQPPPAGGGSGSSPFERLVAFQQLCSQPSPATAGHAMDLDPPSPLPHPQWPAGQGSPPIPSPQLQWYSPATPVPPSPDQFTWPSAEQYGHAGPGLGRLPPPSGAAGPWAGHVAALAPLLSPDPLYPSGDGATGGVAWSSFPVWHSAPAPAPGGYNAWPT